MAHSREFIAAVLLVCFGFEILVTAKTLRGIPRANPQNVSKATLVTWEEQGPEHAVLKIVKQTPDIVRQTTAANATSRPHEDEGSEVLFENTLGVPPSAPSFNIGENGNIMWIAALLMAVIFFWSMLGVPIAFLVCQTQKWTEVLKHVNAIAGDTFSSGPLISRGIPGGSVQGLSEPTRDMPQVLQAVCYTSFVIAYCTFTVCMPEMHEIVGRAGASLWTSGLVIGSYGVGGILSLPMYGYISKRSYKLGFIIQGAMIILGNSTYLYGLRMHWNVWQLSIARALCGAEAGAELISNICIKTCTAKKFRTKASAYNNVAISVGLVLGPFISSCSRQFFDMPGVSNEMVPTLCIIIIMGVLFLAGVILWMPCQREALEMAGVTQAIMASTVDTSSGNSHSGRDPSESFVCERVRHSAAWLALALSLCTTFIRFVQRVAWESMALFIIAVEYKMGSIGAGYVLIMAVSCSGFAGLLLGHYSTRFTNLQVMWVLDLVELVGLFLMIRLGSASTACLVVFLIGSSVFYATNMLQSAPVSSERSKFIIQSHPVLNLEVGQAAVTGLKFVGMLVGPVLMMVMMQLRSTQNVGTAFLFLILLLQILIGSSSLEALADAELALKGASESCSGASNCQKEAIALVKNALGSTLNVNSNGSYKNTEYASQTSGSGGLSSSSASRPGIDATGSAGAGMHGPGACAPPAPAQPPPDGAEVLHAFASWIADTNDAWSDLARTTARLAVMDTVACMVPGAREASTQRVQSTVSEWGQGPATVVGFSQTMSAPWAAMVNGTAAHALDFDDNFDPAKVHASAVLVPSLMALAETECKDEASLIDSYIVGLQIMGLVGQALNPHHRARGWHATSTIGAVGAAAACARLLQLPASQVAHAISMSTSMAGGYISQFGTMTKAAHAGLAAMAGVMASCLARNDMTAGEYTLDGPFGMRTLMVGQDVDELMHALSGKHEHGQGLTFKLESLGNPLMIEEYGLKVKRFPNCGSNHRSLDGLLELMKTHGFTAAMVTKVVCRLPKDHSTTLMFKQPTGGAEAKFSLEYCLAVALMTGTNKLSDFVDEAVADAKIRALFPVIVRDEVDKLESEFDTEVHVTLTSGRVLSTSIHMPIGSKLRPISCDELLSKVQGCLCNQLPQSRHNAIVRHLQAFGGELPISSLMSLLQG